MSDIKELIKSIRDEAAGRPLVSEAKTKDQLKGVALDQSARLAKIHLACSQYLARSLATQHNQGGEVEREREALKPFARIADMEERAGPMDSVMVNVARCRDARAALALPPPSVPEPVKWLIETMDGAFVDLVSTRPNEDAASYYGQKVTPIYAAPAQPALFVTAGWKLVPVEPTKEMWDAGTNAIEEKRVHSQDSHSEYEITDPSDQAVPCNKAMIAAAPTVGGEPE